MYSRFCRQLIWDHVLTTTAVLFHATGLLKLFFNLQSADVLWFALVILLGGLVAGSIDYVVSIRQLSPVRDYFIRRQGGAAGRAVAVLHDWPTRVVRRVILLRLPVFTLALFAALIPGGSWPHPAIGIADLAVLLPYFPIGAAPYAIIAYFFAAANASYVIAEVALEHRSVTDQARPDYHRYTFLLRLALLLMAALPLAQIVVMARILLTAMDVTPEVQQFINLNRWGLLLALIFTATTIHLFVQVVLAPVRRVSKSMRDLAAGRLDVRVVEPAWGEAGALTGGFNAMAESIQAQQQRLAQLHVDTVRALSAAIEARDPYTRGHSDRVGVLAAQIAGVLGWTKEQADELMLTGFLHDVGKIGIPEGTLLKQGPLSPEEWNHVKRHPVVGFQIASQVTDLTPHLSGILHHHERLDGSGYPDGLKGSEIPPSARVLAVADVWDALVSDRPYRSGMPVEKAMSIMMTEVEQNRLDREVVGALRQVCRSDRQTEAPAPSRGVHTDSQRSPVTPNAGSGPSDVGGLLT